MSFISTFMMPNSFFPVNRNLALEIGVSNAALLTTLSDIWIAKTTKFSKDGYTTINHEDITNTIGMSRSEQLQHMKELQSMGLLIVKQRKSELRLMFKEEKYTDLIHSL